MFIIITKSGTRYEVTLGDEPSISRISEEPISNAPEMVLNREPLLALDSPEVGRPLRYRTQHGWVTSTVIMSIDPAISLDVV